MVQIQAGTGVCKDGAVWMCFLEDQEMKAGMFQWSDFSQDIWRCPGLGYVFNCHCTMLFVTLLQTVAFLLTFQFVLDANSSKCAYYESEREELTESEPNIYKYCITVKQVLCR